MFMPGRDLSWASIAPTKRGSVERWDASTPQKRISQESYHAPMAREQESEHALETTNGSVKPQELRLSNRGASSRECVGPRGDSVGGNVSGLGLGIRGPGLQV